MYDNIKIDKLIENFNKSHEIDPMNLAIDTFIGLINAGMSEQSALKLTEVISNNYYKNLKIKKEGN